MLFTWLTQSGPCRVTTSRERKLCITHIIFWPYMDMESLPEWVISSMPGSPPRQHKHERRYTPSKYPFILTRRIWKDDYDGQMIFGEPCGPKASWHLSYRWGKIRKKNLTQETCPESKYKFTRQSIDDYRTINLFPRPGIEPGPAAWQASMLPPVPQRWALINFLERKSMEIVWKCRYKC